MHWADLPVPYSSSQAEGDREKNVATRKKDSRIQVTVVQQPADVAGGSENDV